MIESVSVFGGYGKNGKQEPVGKVEFKMGDVISIVGSTGSGKTTFINDIELFAYDNTPSGRRVLINGKPAPQEYKDNPSSNPIALITQHTTFLSDLPVYEFLMAHAGIRSNSKASMEQMVQSTLEFANKLTGEPIALKSRMTELSGGQTRSLMIADATIICNTPIVLLDEVENAGINRTKALELLRQHHKIFIFVTHDPRIALLSDFRIVMENGCMTQIQKSSVKEQAFSVKVGRLDGILSGLRDKIRRGEMLTGAELEGIV
ncbi:MAG: hypothetical protein CSYNP_04209 [Syntrophus sp. SKADARSKE-3]|nr:hypothetical protein [Syntrophus sp. SKADARSKE-3]